MIEQQNEGDIKILMTRGKWLALYWGEVFS